MRRRQRAEHRRQGPPSAAVAVALLNRARRMWSAARPFMQCVAVRACTDNALRAAYPELSLQVTESCTPPPPYPNPGTHTPLVWIRPVLQQQCHGSFREGALGGVRSDAGSDVQRRRPLTGHARGCAALQQRPRRLQLACSSAEGAALTHARAASAQAPVRMAAMWQHRKHGRRVCPVAAPARSCSCPVHPRNTPCPQGCCPCAEAPCGRTH